MYVTLLILENHGKIMELCFRISVETLILLPYVLYCIRFYRTSACVWRTSENCKSDKCNI